MKLHKFTYFLLVLVFATLGVTFGRHQQTPRDNAKENEYSKQLQARKLRFPTADYEETELADAKKNEKLKQKKIRKNDFKFVARNPPYWQTERVATNEGGMDFPGLPVAESTFIILGKITSAEAHVSENKKNVYSEFTVVVEKVFKTADSSIIERTELTIDRTGGFVKYPNGQSVLYRFSGMNMPLIGERYLFFLTSKNQQDISILTGYELGATVTPLDESLQFEKYRGLTEDVLLQNLRDSLAKSSPY